VTGAEGMPPGYTLPVWVAAAARAATAALLGAPHEEQQPLALLDGDAGERAPVPVLAAARLGVHRALAMARCDPGPGLDLTRDLLVWVMAGPGDAPGLTLEAGEGVGRHRESGEACVSAYARRLLETNVAPLLPAGGGVRLRVILPEGERLARHTSNAAFGVVEGLALIGMQAHVRSSAAPDQLAAALERVRQVCRSDSGRGRVVVVIGENGIDLAGRLGFPAELLVKAGNWLGPVLVEAARCGARELLLFGYHGKLVKLAGGIFHTHHHLADGRREVITALAALEGLGGAPLRRLHAAATVDEAFRQLAGDAPDIAERLQRRLAAEVESRSLAYVRRHGSFEMRIGCAWFDRARTLSGLGPRGRGMVEALLG
jgi:cobalt-precorrin-5B (C1)-methyltransferase